MRARLIVAAAVIGTGVCLGAPAAMAGPGEGNEYGSGARTDDVITATVVYETDGGSGGGGGGASECTWRQVDGQISIPMGTANWPMDIDGKTHHLWLESCPNGQFYYSLPETDPVDLLPALLEQLRQQALPKPVPEFLMLDRDFGWAYVRTPVDFRAGGAWRPVSVTASIGPLWATVTATPTRLTFDPGDPAGFGPTSCSGSAPTAPYFAAEPGACSYTYLNASSTSPIDGYHFQTSMRIDWAISWTSSTGAGGVLEPYSTSASAPLAVAEVKGLVTCTGPRPEQGGC